MVKFGGQIVALVALTALSAAAIGQNQPNVIVIISDDAGYADFGFTDGISGTTSTVPTPHLDDLASRGVRLSRAYVAANCQPTRAAIVTGGYQQRIGNESVGDDHFRPDEPFEGVPVETDTIWDRMKTQGYATGAVGKWHLGSIGDTTDSQGNIVKLGNRPENQGIDEFYGFWHGSRNYEVGSYNTSPTNINDPLDNLQSRYFREVVRDGDGNVTTNIVEDDRAGEYITNTMGDYGVQFIKDHAAASNPFMLYQSFTAPHKPWDEVTPAESDPEFLNAIAPYNLTGDRKRVAAMMYTMDKEIGRMMAALDDPNGDGNTSDSIRDNTLVMFVNDNGGVGTNPQITDNGILHGVKGSPLDGGIRVPMIIAGAGVDPSKQGTTYDRIVHGIDILPTAFELAGGTFEPSDDKIDGVNLLPFLNGTDTDDPHEVLVHRWQGSFAVVTQDWKLVNRQRVRTREDRYQLYNISNDMDESNDLIDQSQHAELVAKLKRDLTDHEAFFDKPRYAIYSNTLDSEPLNIFDHHVFNPNAGDADWSGGKQDGDGYFEDANATLNWFEAGTTNPRHLLRADGFAGAILEFPTHNSGYTANNDLVRRTGLEFMLNKIVLSGNYNSSASHSATIQGLDLLFTNDLDGGAPEIAVDASNSGSGSFSYAIDLNLVMYDDLAITGDGDTQVAINGDIRDYFDARSLTKSGTGTVTLHGNNTYKGDTKVEAGTLSISETYLEDTADVYLTAGATFDLNFNGSDTIDSLFIDGVSRAVGTWGAIGSGANHESSLLTGQGMLLVSTFAGLPGDFNNDGMVNLADYTVWRDNVGAAAGTLPNDSDGGVIGAAQYTTWKQSFGNSQNGNSQASGAAVPEPGAAYTILPLLLASVWWSRRAA